MTKRQAPLAADPILPPGRSLLNDLLVSTVVSQATWKSLPSGDAKRIESCLDHRRQLELLVEYQLLTEYQGKRIADGDWNGLILGNYRILDRIGSGGSGIVYLAEHRVMGRVAAIKVLNRTADPDDPLLIRFFTEIRAISRLQHPNIAAALDAGEFPSRMPGAEKAYFLVMEYVEGQDLETLVRHGGPLTPRRSCEVVYQLAQALAEAHCHGIIHRDVKPSNLRITLDGRVKLLDFGLALCPRHRLTKAGVPLGTPDYMAPEQAQGASDSDARTDIYGLGGVLFWCLTGQRPFPAQQNIFQSLMTRIHQAPPSAVLIRPDVPAFLDSVLARAMATDPGDRYPNAAAVMGALATFMAQQEG